MMNFVRYIYLLFAIIIIVLSINPLVHGNADEILLNIENTKIMADTIMQYWGDTGKIVIRNCNLAGQLRCKSDTIVASLEIINCNISDLWMWYGLIEGNVFLIAV